MVRTVLLLCLGLPLAARAYCNAMGPSGYGPRTSKAFPPGWNGLAKTPPRGWRSWYAYYTHMNQPMIEKAIDALAAKNRTVKGWEGKVSLCDLGYCSAGIDEGWEGCGLGVNGTQHYLNGTPAVNPTLFPDMKGLVDYGHAKGLQMGFYQNGCGCAEKREPASGWTIDYEGDAKALAEFGFDAVKFDGCGRLCNLTFQAQLNQATGKAYTTENCHWGACTEDDASSCPTADWCPFNLYRVSGDSDNALGTWYKNLQQTVRFSSSWDAPLSRPGCWAYPDMLQVGRLGCDSRTSGCPPTKELLPWTRAHFAAFAIVSSPLVLSIHPSDENLAGILDIIGNKQALAINKAWTGHPGTLVKTLPPATPPVPPVKPGNSAVGVLPNASDTTQTGWRYDSAGHTLRRGDLCLSCDGKDLPLTLTACGNSSTFQNFTFDAATGEFHINAPAGGTALYPFCLQNVGTGTANKIDAYNCKGSQAQKFAIVAGAGTLCLADGSSCIAGRDAYNPPAAGVAGVQWWAKPLGSGRTAALFLNGGSLPYRANISMAELNATAGASAVDVWTGADAGAVVDGVFDTGVVASLDSRFVVFESK